MHGGRAFAAAGLSGALLALSFPTFGHPASAWVACIPLLIALHDIKSVRRAFWLGLTTGAVYFGGTLPWLTAVMVSFAGFPQLLGVLINGLRLKRPIGLAHGDRVLVGCGAGSARAGGTDPGCAQKSGFGSWKIAKSETTPSQNHLI